MVAVGGGLGCAARIAVRDGPHRVPGVRCERGAGVDGGGGLLPRGTRVGERDDHAALDRLLADVRALLPLERAACKQGLRALVPEYVPYVD